MLSLPDMLLLSGIALMVFGPERLPQVAREVGRITGELRATSSAFMNQIEQSAAAPPIPPHERNASHANSEVLATSDQSKQPQEGRPSHYTHSDEVVNTPRSTDTSAQRDPRAEF